MILLDTHVVVWLYAGEVEMFPPGVRRLLDASELTVSPIVEVELAYLSEIGRMIASPTDVLGELAGRMGLTVAQISFGQLCAEAVALSWTRDPFDRLQAAHAIAKNMALVTRDTRIRKHLRLATWPE